MTPTPQQSFGAAIANSLAECDRLHAALSTLVKWAAEQEATIDAEGTFPSEAYDPGDDWSALLEQVKIAAKALT